MSAAHSAFQPNIEAAALAHVLHVITGDGEFACTGHWYTDNRREDHVSSAIAAGVVHFTDGVFASRRPADSAPMHDLRRLPVGTADFCYRTFRNRPVPLTRGFQMQGEQTNTKYLQAYLVR